MFDNSLVPRDDRQPSHADLIVRLAEIEQLYVEAHDAGVRLAQANAPFADLVRHAEATVAIARVRTFLEGAVTRSAVVAHGGGLAQGATGPTDGPGWASVSQIASQYGCTPQTIRNRLHAHDIEGARVGRSWVVNRSSAADFFARFARLLLAKDEEASI